mmetsp:Transcript_14362/g.43369  ORF Transcript_14362/g.43369 Transcript_14362/m.43369 type:complete len:624 (-) Transcript_14362:2418-4289(-)
MRSATAASSAWNMVHTQIMYRARMSLQHTCCRHGHSQTAIQSANRAQGIKARSTSTALPSTQGQPLQRPNCTFGSSKSASHTQRRMRCTAATEEAGAETPQSVGEHVTPSGLPPLRLYNSLSQTKEVFTPRPDQGDAVSMYVCGVTVYSMSHIGHARVYVAFDVLYRYLQQLGYKVQYVRNFTDVDDKIITAANEQGIATQDLCQRFIREFQEDMAAVGCLEPTLEPLATEYVPDMVATIQAIIDNGHAYVAEGGDVFFDTKTLPHYGRLSRLVQDEGSAGQRVGVDARKRSPADFVLWKPAKAGEPSWGSPWGPGRPGWHIECSAMIRKLMGPLIDIHGGGRDLQFPHHENELAQSEAAACSCDKEHMAGGGKDFVRWWVHNGFVNVDSEKMSKSLGNFFTIRQAIEKYSPSALRFWLLSAHYRAAVNYTERSLEEASDRLYSLYYAVQESRTLLQGAGKEGTVEMAKAEQQVARPGGNAVMAEVHAAMQEDLGTPQAIAALSAPVTRINDLLFSKKGKRQQDRLQQVAALSTAVTATFQLLGLPITDAAASMEELRQMALKRAGLTEADVEQLIEDRATAREARDFAEADAIRARLLEKGILMMDTRGGTFWRPGVQELPS